MKASLSIAVLLGAIFAAAAPADVASPPPELYSGSSPSLPTNLTADVHNIEAPTDQSVSGSETGPPVCGTCHGGTKKCCGMMVATGAFGCFSKDCVVAQQQKIGTRIKGLMKGLQHDNSTVPVSSTPSASPSADPTACDI